MCHLGFSSLYSPSPRYLLVQEKAIPPDLFHCPLSLLLPRVLQGDLDFLHQDPDLDLSDPLDHTFTQQCLSILFINPLTPSHLAASMGSTWHLISFIVKKPKTPLAVFAQLQFVWCVFLDLLHSCPLPSASFGTFRVLVSTY